MNSTLRANIYQLFSVLFSAPPPKELIGCIKKYSLFRKIWTFYKCLNLIDESFDFVEDPSWTEKIEDIEEEYARLFSVPSNSYIPPYQSVYTDMLRVELGRTFGRQGDAPPLRLKGYLGGECNSLLTAIYR